MNKNVIAVKRINSNLFKALVMFVREPTVTLFAEEVEYYSNENKTILGVILYDIFDSDYNCVLLCRDEFGKFRAFDVKADFSIIKDARDWIVQNIRWHTSKGLTVFPQSEGGSGIELFKEIIPIAKQHPIFQLLQTQKTSIPARRILSEVSRFFTDIDGNFIEQFQSINGFDARLWEIYLFCFFTEELFKIKRNKNAPDFIIEKLENEIAVEAFIIGRLKSKPVNIKFNRIDIMNEKDNSIERGQMPLRYSNALVSKLNKEYWKLDHVKGKALIFAMADFHDDLSMTWSYNALIEYLFGLKFTHYYNEKGELVINPAKVLPYVKESGSEVQSGFFYQENAENVSAVLFTSNANLSKFTRMGVQAGFKAKGQKVMRFGVRFVHDPNASVPKEFHYEVNEDGVETWAEGANMYHNPFAKYPIDRKLFPSIAHHYLEDGMIVSYNPEFHPYFSYTYNIVKNN